ncbi:MAG: hypothetical protein WC719_03500 [Patescibacteria group bacterium]|jgi:hypothetical protein
MSHEIEAEFIADWPNEMSQCRHCASFTSENGKGFCSEAQSEVPAGAHCDFFQSID